MVLLMHRPLTPATDIRTIVSDRVSSIADTFLFVGALGSIRFITLINRLLMRFAASVASFSNAAHDIPAAAAAALPVPLDVTSLSRSATYAFMMSQPTLRVRSDTWDMASATSLVDALGRYLMPTTAPDVKRSTRFIIQVPEEKICSIRRA
jgi:hypothetical protein